MISTFSIICLYVLGVLTMSLPLALSLIIKMKFSVKLVKYALLPLGLYIAVSILLNPMAIELILSLFTPNFEDRAALYNYWQTEQPLGYSIITVLSQAVFVFLTFLITFKFLNNEMRIYEAAMFAVFFSVIDAISSTISIGSYASLAIHSNQGTISELVSDNMSLETLNANLEVLKQYGAYPSLLDFIHIILVMAALILLALFIFHGFKTKKYYFFAFAFLTYFASYFIPQVVSIYSTELITKFFKITDGDLHLHNYNLLLIVLLLLTVLYVGAVVLYYIWYRGQQKDLAEKMQAYKEYIKKN